LKKWEARIENASTRDIELILDSIYNMDQKYRREIQGIRQTFGTNSPEMINLLGIMTYTDSSNLEVVKIVLDKKGWIGSNDIGHKANACLFLSIQHADLATQLKYLHLMRTAALEGKASKQSLAMLEDRVALRQGKKQIYGSQVGVDSLSGKNYLLPLENPDSVDFRRHEMGMIKLKYYLEPYNINWDVEAYKNQLIEGDEN
jgi:hypothetical protein